MPPPATAPSAAATLAGICRSRTTHTAAPAQMTSARMTKTHVEPEPIEKAAPVFMTSDRSSTPGTSGAGPPASAVRAQAFETWSSTTASAATPPNAAMRRVPDTGYSALEAAATAWLQRQHRPSAPSGRQFQQRGHFSP